MVTSKKNDEVTVLNEQKGLYLQPYCRINIKVHIPEIKGVGKSISNWEIMEKLRTAIKPNEFSQLKVDSITREMVAFEAELLTRQSKKLVIQSLHGKQLKLSGFSSAFTISANENKSDNYPTQQDWESFFADKDQTELGERPDTVVIDNLPCYWFMDTSHNNTDHKPNQDVVMQVFNKFGPIRCLHIPLLDQYDKSIDNPFQTFSFNNQLNFKVFIQYQEYQGFCQAIQQLKGMKLLYRLSNPNQTGQKKEMLAKMLIDFDKTAHLSSKNIRKRRFEKLKLQQLQKEAEEKAKQEQRLKEQLQKQQEDEQRRLEQERIKHKLEQERLKKEKRQHKIRLKNQRKQRRQEKRQTLHKLKLQLQSELDQRRKDAEAKLTTLHLENKDRARKLLLYLLEDIANLHMEKVEKLREQQTKRKQLANEKALRRRLIKKIKKQETRKRALKRELLCRQIDAASLKSVVVKK